ncbi:K02A2.6-like [Cordylochernes scorpioides]|uniref:K02A2.6-like n=1 Tax=Cordylochernes scorpioides TaxID=51811 RepID=A0ABY6JX23_9ARAC|nr:K02A2.6-like [Cordylochernes scorpioides]
MAAGKLIPFLQDGIQSMDFDEYVRYFNNYMIAEDKLNVEENRKIAIFLNSVGAEAQRQYYTLPKASTVTSLSEAIDLLRQRYVVKSRPWVIRMKFNDRRQLQGETIADYISALCALAKDCAYGSMEDELIRDRFIVGTKIKQLRDRLLVETTDLNLDQVVQLATQYEKAQEDNKMFDNTPEGINKIAANDRRTEPNLRERKKISTNFKCLRCGANPWTKLGLDIVGPFIDSEIGFRSTPHTVTKQTPSAVVHGRTLRTLVHVFDKEVKTKPPEEACRQEDKSDSESKSCSPKLQVGDQVKVQAGDPVMKGRSKLRGPFTITKQLRPFTFVLSDGKVWNARRLRLYQKGAGTYTRPDIRHELGIHPALHLDDPASQEESTPPPDSSPIASRLRSKFIEQGCRTLCITRVLLDKCSCLLKLRYRSTLNTTAPVCDNLDHGNPRERGSARGLPPLSGRSCRKQSPNCLQSPEVLSDGPQDPPWNVLMSKVTPSSCPSLFGLTFPDWVHKKSFPLCLDHDCLYSVKTVKVDFKLGIDGKPHSGAMDHEEKSAVIVCPDYLTKGDFSLEDKPRMGRPHVTDIETLRILVMDNPQ